MRALQYQGRNKVEVGEVPDPQILNSRDAIVKITSTAICGSDLHLVDGYVPTVYKGDVLGHEFMGEVVEVGKGVSNLKTGQKVIVPFPIACGACDACRHDLFSCCENSNPNSGVAEKLLGHSPAGLFGYSHMLGGYPGGQAEYARVPFADVGPLVVDGHADESVLFLTDILPTGWMGAEQCGIEGGEVIAVWGAGPVGQFAAESAQVLGAERVIVVDRFPERLAMAQGIGCEVLDYTQVDVPEALKEMTGGRGPDAVIDAVGMEAHHSSLPLHAYDRAKQAVRQETDRPLALREAIQSVKNGGTVSVVGVYGGFIDKFPMGAVLNRSLTLRGAQTHVHRYTRPLLERIEKGELHPERIITHRLPLDEAPHGYDIFKNKKEGCVKVVLKAA